MNNSSKKLLTELQQNKFNFFFEFMLSHFFKRTFNSQTVTKANK